MSNSMFNKKLLLLTLLTAMSWLGIMAQNVNVHGTVTNETGDPQNEVNIIVSVFFADSSAALYSTYTNTSGTYSVDVATQDPSLLGFLEVSMVDCWGTTESQYFTIINGNEVFEADFVYCQEIVQDSCVMFVFQEWNPNGQTQLTAWVPPSQEVEYAWSTGETTQTIFPQVSGQYCVTATFSFGCVETDCIEVNLDSTGFCFAYIVSYLNPDSTTYDLVAIPEGIAPFTYLWDNGSVSSTLQGVGPGTYCVIVTDATGCAYTTCIIVDDFNFCEVYIYENPGGGLYAQGYGQNPITYLWNTGESSQEIFPIDPGLYCVTMYDNDGCSTSSCYDYGWSQDSCFVYVSAFLTDSNTFTLQAFGYTSAPEWSFLWSTGETTDIIYPQDPTQTYCVTMTDSEGCVSSACYESSNYCYAWVDLQYVDTATAVLTVYTDPIFNMPGGITPTYLWSNGATTSVLTVTQSGEYCVTVTIDSICVTESCSYVDFENLGNDCSAWVFTYPDSSGQWYAEAYAWGWGAFEYSWSNGDTTSVTQIEGPAAFTCVTVTSSFGCETVACVDTFFLPCEAYITVYYPSNNTAELTATIWNDPNQNATFLWSTGETGSTIIVSEEGNYCVTTMAGGCVKTTCIDVYFWNVDSCGVWISADPSSGSGVEYTANAWGVPPFTYLWSNGGTEQTNFVDFGIHELCVTVTDSLGCVSTGCNFKADSCYVSLNYSTFPTPSIEVQSFDPIAFVSWSNGDSSNWIEITEPGVYCATVTTIFGCVQTQCITIDTIIPGEGQNVISGYVFGDTLSSLQGQVFAYGLNSGGSYDLVDSALIQNAFYSFDGLSDGLYLLKAIMAPGTQDAEDYIPTYHISSATWEDAVILQLPNWLPVTKDIYMIRSTDFTGGGVIGGFVSDPNHLVAGGHVESRGTGIANVQVLLKDAQGLPLNYQYTLAEGGFRFTNLPWGTYRISYDIPGLTSPDIWVTLTPENPEKLQVTLIVNQGTTAVNDPKLEEIKLYPNPAKEEINMPLPGVNTNYDIHMIDMQGKVVYTGSVRNTNGVITVGVGSLAPGLYHINLKGDHGHFYGRFIKQD